MDTEKKIAISKKKSENLRDSPGFTDIFQMHRYRKHTFSFFLF